jgi:hypothetical protein
VKLDKTGRCEIPVIPSPNSLMKNLPDLTEGSAAASLTVFFLQENLYLCRSELFSRTIDVEPRRMGSEQEWPPKLAGLF